MPETTNAHSPTQNIARSLGLPVADSQTLANALTLDLLATTHAASPDLKDRAAQAYQAITGESIADHRVMPTAILGLPGMGRMTTFKTAAQNAATALGLSLVVNPSRDQTITAGDFVFVSLELPSKDAGSVIASEAESYGNEAIRLTQSMDVHLGQAKKAGGALVLLEDITGASTSTQDLLLSLTEAHRLHSVGMGGVSVGMTGDLNTAVNLSAAFRAQVQVRGIDAQNRNDPAMNAAMHEVATTGYGSTPAVRSNAETDNALNAKLMPKGVDALDLNDPAMNAAMHEVAAIGHGVTPTARSNAETDMVINAKLMRGFPSLKDIGTKLSQAEPDEASPSIPVTRRQP